jgi:hypothetical protein
MRFFEATPGRARWFWFWFCWFCIFLHQNETTAGWQDPKIKFSLKINSPYCTLSRYILCCLPFFSTCYCLLQHAFLACQVSTNTRSCLFLSTLCCLSFVKYHPAWHLQITFLSILFKSRSYFPEPHVPASFYPYPLFFLFPDDIFLVFCFSLLLGILVIIFEPKICLTGGPDLTSFLLHHLLDLASIFF